MPERREPLPWTRFSYDDFLDDPAVVRMGDSLIGPYLHLLRAAWKAELHGWPPGHLPNDPTYLAHASRMLDAWPEHASSIGRAFEVTEKWWIQRRIVREYDSARREGRENSRRASGAAKARWMRPACPEHAPSMPGAMQEVRGREVESKNQSQKTAAAPRQDTGPAQVNGNGKGPPESLRDLVQIRTYHRPDKGKEAFVLLGQWWKAGFHSQPHLLALVDWYVERRESIKAPMAYFNPRSAAFRDMHASISARLSEAEGAAFKDRERAAIRDRALAEVRADVEQETP